MAILTRKNEVVVCFFPWNLAGSAGPEVRSTRRDLQENPRW
jgi:hypothetical protein